MLRLFAADWPEQGFDRLHALGFKTAALALRSDSVSVDDPALKSEEKLAVILGTEEKLAVILGTEGDGLSHHTIAGCDYTVRIPMCHGVDSLNVGNAAAVAFWELRPR